MTRITEKSILILSDFLAVNIAYVIVYILRFYIVLLESDTPPTAAGVILGGGFLSLAWIVVFLLFGLYRSKFAVSRTDEIVTVFKAVSLGTMTLFVLTFNLSDPLPLSRLIILNYWIFLIFFLSIGRIAIRTYQRNRLKKGIGRRKTLIIGTGKQARKVYDQIRINPLTGFDAIGFLKTSSHTAEETGSGKVFGSIEQFDEVCVQNDIEEVLIILDRPSKTKLFEIVDKCNGYPVVLRTVPDIYEIAVGNAHIQHMYGLDLVEILPENYSAGFRAVKRFIDIAVSSAIILLFLPLWVLIGFIIKLNSQGPVFYKQKRIGRNGEDFVMYKFRSMVMHADTAPIHRLTLEKDARITAIGSFIRRFRIDEIPQMINVLEGDMSLIGPRPELPFYVREFVKQIPLYSKRLRIKPGITGLAQVKQKFSESVTDIKKKLEYDLFYIENMSLKLDLKITLATIVTILTRRGG